MKQRGKQKGGTGVEERDIIERLLGRDESGLHDLLRYYGPLMRYIIAPIVPDPHHREDCLSEAAMRVWDRVGSSTQPGQLQRLAHCGGAQYRQELSESHAIPSKHPGPGRKHPRPPSPPRRSCFCGRNGRPPLTGPWPVFPPKSRPSFTENIITYSPPPRLPPSWALRSGRWRASSTG